MRVAVLAKAAYNELPCCSSASLADIHAVYASKHWFYPSGRGPDGGREELRSRATMFPSSALRLSCLRRDVSRARWGHSLASLSSNRCLGDDFALHLNVFSEEEQKILLAASLSKLDRAEDGHRRKRRKVFEARRAEKLSERLDVNSLFLPNHYYDFQKVTCRLNSNAVVVVLTPSIRVITMGS